MTAEGNKPQDEARSSEDPCAKTKAGAAEVAVGRILFLAIVAAVALLQAAPFLAMPDYVPKIQDQIRWAITAVILFRAWQGAPAAITVARLGLALGAIVYLCRVAVWPEEWVLSLFHAVVYGALGLVMIYSRAIQAYLGEERQSDTSTAPNAHGIAIANHGAVHHASALHKEPSPPTDDEWPRCPQCEAPRLTRCPYCRTSGTNFLKADHPPHPALFDGEHDVDVFHPSEGSSCSCGPAGCVPSPTPHQEESRAAEDAAGMLVCSMCDEPFHPSYLRQCEWCGHDFGDGFVADMLAPQYEPVNMRVVAVLVGLVIFGVAVLAYFALLVPPAK